MNKTLKQRNQPQLIVFLVANVLCLATVALGWRSVSALLSAVAKGDFSLLGKIVAVPTLASLALGIISWLIPKPTKETLVFWRMGARRMPSSDAFNRIAPSDPRIDIDRLTQRVGSFPTTPEKQSTRWYEIYRKHRSEASVEDANSAYLLYREMTALIVLLACVVMAVEVTLALPWRSLTFSVAGLVGEYFVVALAAKNAGNRLVANVLAIEAALEQKTGGKVARNAPGPEEAGSRGRASSKPRKRDSTA